MGALHCADCQLGPYHESQEFHITALQLQGLEYLLEPVRYNSQGLGFHKVEQELLWCKLAQHCTVTIVSLEADFYWHGFFTLLMFMLQKH